MTKHSKTLIKIIVEIVARDLVVLLWEPQNHKSKEIKYKGWNNRTQKTLSRCVSNNKILHNECLSCFYYRIYISISILKGLTSMFEYMCRNWKRGNGAY